LIDQTLLTQTLISLSNRPCKAGKNKQMSAMLARRLALQATMVRRMATAAKHEHHTNSALWRKVTLFVCLPCIAMAMVNTYLSHIEHAKHPRRPFQPYDYLYIRRKRFPWGDGNRSLFHNPLTNALPEGYETEDPHHH
jgi:cytochrome c oxidase subunit 6a